MPSADVYAAVKARLDANPIEGWPYRGPNDPSGEVLADASPFVTFEFPVSTSEQITFGSPGSNTFRETGSLRFVVSMVRGVDAAGNSGIAAGLAVADRLRALFRNWQDGGLRFWEFAPPLTDDSNGDASYYRLSTAGTYWYDTWA